MHKKAKILSIILYAVNNFVAQQGMNRTKVKGKKKESAEEKVRTEEFRNVLPSINMIIMIFYRRMRWVEHVACTGERREAYKI
jgi:hypothetical protein